MNKKEWEDFFGGPEGIAGARRGFIEFLRVIGFLLLFICAIALGPIGIVIFVGWMVWMFAKSHYEEKHKTEKEELEREKFYLKEKLKEREQEIKKVNNRNKSISGWYDWKGPVNLDTENDTEQSD